MSNALALPKSTHGPRGSGGRTDSAMARQADVAGGGIDWTEIRAVCSAAIKAGILPKSIQREEQAVAIALKSRELGIPPMQGFSQIHMIQGVASCSAQLMLALAYRHLPEFDLNVVESTATKATIEFRRDAKRTPVRLTYTIEQAKAAGLTGKDNWRNHPDDMLRNRVVSKGLRIVAPDVFAGLYLPDEVESGTHLETVEVEPVSIPSRGRPVVEAGTVPVDAAPIEAASDEAKADDTTATTDDAPDEKTIDADLWRRDVLAAFAEFKKAATPAEFDAVKVAAKIVGKTPPQLTPADIDAINDAMPSPFKIVF